MKKQIISISYIIAFSLMLIHCGDDPKKTPAPTPTFSIGGTVTGITTGTLVIRNNGGDDLSITADGSFTFATKIKDGGDYDVSIKTIPAGLSTCTVTNGTGVVINKNVSNIKVDCS